MPETTSNSLESILTFDQKNLDSYSVVISTLHIPGMDDARGITTRRTVGRRRIRIGSLAFAALLTMHCRVGNSAFTGGYFIFMMILTSAVVVIANAMRHFEVYLGQWSVSGPGRAFRSVPMLDGIGYAMCINSLVRAIYCVCAAAMAGTYVFHGLSDLKLPYTYCRDFDLNGYTPVISQHRDALPYIPTFEDFFKYNVLSHLMFNTSHYRATTGNQTLHEQEVCLEVYNSSDYPPVINTPHYNFFYVELAKYREGGIEMLFEFNTNMLIALAVIWGYIWATVIFEKITYGRMIWNNMHPWIIIIPILWSVFVMATAFKHFHIMRMILSPNFRMSKRDILTAIIDASNVALYIHSASTGTELIHGKGLHHYALGHIDPLFSAENVWHSLFLVLLTGCHAGGTAVCSVIDCMNTHNATRGYVRESTLWILPMYSQCTLQGDYSHFTSTMIFSGLAISYAIVACVLFKIVIHIIFEYKVKLVFYEVLVVLGVLVPAMLLSAFSASASGLLLLESVDAWLIGVGMPLICLMELIALMYVYRSHDFISDMDAANEDSACAPRVGYQWQYIPFVIGILLLLECTTISKAEMPLNWILIGLTPIIVILLVMPIRAYYNFTKYVKPAIPSARRNN